MSLKSKVDSVNSVLAKPNDSSVIHLQTLRKAIGWIALSLPFTLALGENVRDWAFSVDPTAERAFIESSISAYFHTGMREVFVGTLCAIGVFLLCYRGYERRDNVAAKIAGLAALVVAMFPTAERSREATDASEVLIDSATLFSSARVPDPAYVGVLHLAAAVIFFVTLAVMALFLFTRTSGNVTPEKKRRNVIYRVTGWVILACIAVIAVAKLALDQAWVEQLSLVFWLETIAIIAFAISWLTKAEIIFGDPVMTRSAKA